MVVPPPVYADVESASDDYARRFSGEVGLWFLDVQARLTLGLLDPTAEHAILDVGGGHGQLTGPLTEAGYAVTVLASDARCRTRVEPWTTTGRAQFDVGDLLELPYDDRTFDIAMAFRLLPHVDEWDRLLAELARVSRRGVIVDYPTFRSANAVSELLFTAKKNIEGDTRPFTVFRDRDVENALRSADFGAFQRRPQFFFPMAVHRALSRAQVSRALETAARSVGLVKLFGSPVILRANRRE